MASFSQVEQLEVTKKILNGDYEKESQFTPSLEKPYFWTSKRYYVVLLLFWQYYVVFTTRGNISIAIVEMTSNRSIIVDNKTINISPDFQWDSRYKGLVFSIEAYASPFLIISGYVINKIGGRTASIISLIICGVLSISFPLLLHTSPYLFLAGRFMEGIFKDVMFCAPLDVLSKWVIPLERARLTSFAISGHSFGAVMSSLLFGFLAYNWGWPSIFYVTGGTNLLIAWIWLFTIGNEPSKDKWITRKEVAYLQRELKDTSNRKQMRCSWKRVLTSPAFWAFAMAKISSGLCFTLISLCLPSYIKDRTNWNIKTVGFLSALPIIGGLVATPISGFLCDYLRNGKYFTPTETYKLFITGGIILSAAFAFGTAFASGFYICLILLFFFKASYAMFHSNTHALLICMAPNFPGIVFGYIGLAHSLGNAVGATLFGTIVKSHSTYEWNVFFISSALCLLICAAVFQCFGSAENQRWEYLKKDEVHDPDT